MEVIPFAASLAWYRQWYRHRYQEGAAPVGTRRDLNRCIVEGGLRLTVSVEGSRAALKRLPREKLQLSEHGNWRHVHLGAWNALYGKAPYFDHLFPRMKEAYERDYPSLAGFTQALHAIVVETLNLPEAAASMGRQDEQCIKEMGEELRRRVPEEYSLFHLLMDHGPLAIFALV